MSLLRRRETREAFPEPIISPFPGVSLFGNGSGAVSVDQALRVSAVWACVRLLADSVAMMPLHAYTMDGPTRMPIPDPPLLRQPSQTATLPDFLYMLMASLLLRGNAYGRIVARDYLGFPKQIELMNPDEVFVRVDKETGQLTYRNRGGPLNAADVFHVRAFRFPGSQLGLSPITYAATQIQTDLAIESFANQFFADGAHPSSIIHSKTPMSEDQARTMKERFRAAVKGREPAVLTGDLTYQQIQIKPEESQFLNTQKYGTAEIARVYGVPPEMIAAEAGHSMTYANVEQRSLDFLTFSVQPWLTRIEAAFTPLLPGVKHTKFDTSVLLRTDFNSLMTGTAIGIASHQMTPDEARAMRDAPPMTEAQKAISDLIPMTVSPTGRPRAVKTGAPVGVPTPVVASDLTNPV